MREIKFRGQKVNTKEWIYGSLIITNNLYEICDDSTFSKWREEVETETVGQFTGLKDKDGKDIYENDILSVPYITPFGVNTQEEDLDLRSSVSFQDGMFGLKYKHHITSLQTHLTKEIGDYIPNYGNKVIISDSSTVTVIGNTHEHPELL
jgi:uncharacterized phage protein (TIGR01671 family)